MFSTTNFPLSLAQGALGAWAQWLTCVQGEGSPGREGEEDCLYIIRKRFNLNITEKSMSSSTVRHEKRLIVAFSELCLSPCQRAGGNQAALWKGWTWIISPCPAMPS